MKLWLLWSNLRERFRSFTCCTAVSNGENIVKSRVLFDVLMWRINAWNFCNHCRRKFHFWIKAIIRNRRQWSEKTDHIQYMALGSIVQTWFSSVGNRLIKSHSCGWLWYSNIPWRDCSCACWRPWEEKVLSLSDRDDNYLYQADLLRHRTSRGACL